MTERDLARGCGDSTPSPRTAAVSPPAATRDDSPPPLGAGDRVQAVLTGEPG
ncbi:hypothetical protein ACIQAC_16400 [Streptomyces sp. NPDC088387]|uniref:hypothetical protein n=1 Tax=Streptomyces sp. NPDC088387 TaxID=3365859 RepID=UPI0038118AEF